VYFVVRSSCISWSIPRISWFGTEQEFSSSYEHLEGDTTGVVDPDVFFFEAHL